MIGVYIVIDATIKHIMISRKFALFFSMINNEITSHNKSLEILMIRNFIPAFSFPYRYILNITKTIIFKTAIKEMTIKLSKRFIVQK